MKGDSERLWVQVQEAAERALDRVEAAPGFAEPTVRIHISTVFWLQGELKRLNREREIFRTGCADLPPEKQASLVRLIRSW